MNWIYKDIIYDFSLYDLVWYFLIYAFLGWCMEVVYAAFKTKSFINRGFLNGTVCPLYGAGAVFVIISLDPVKNHPFLIFILSMLITTTIEFLTGLILELLYHKKWWDYSMRKFNIKGYVCLEFSLIWGALCLLVYDILQPFITYPINHIPHIVGIWLLLALVIAFIIDIVISTIQATRFAKYVTKVRNDYRKSSDAIGGKLASTTINVMNKIEEIKISRANKRLLKAFPEMKDQRDKNILNILREKLNVKKKEEKFSSEEQKNSL